MADPDRISPPSLPSPPTGGALNGTYSVSSEAGGIGHASIVIDNKPSQDVSGRLGTGNASVTLEHSYGDLALALSTKAPSIFAGITTPFGSAGGLGSSVASGVGRSRPLGMEEGDACHSPTGGQAVAAIEWPAGFEWMAPSGPLLAPHLA